MPFILTNGKENPERNRVGSIADREKNQFNPYTPRVSSIARSPRNPRVSSIARSPRNPRVSSITRSPRYSNIARSPKHPKTPMCPGNPVLSLQIHRRACSVYSGQHTSKASGSHTPCFEHIIQSGGVLWKGSARIYQREKTLRLLFEKRFP